VFLSFDHNHPILSNALSGKLQQSLNCYSQFIGSIKTLRVLDFQVKLMPSREDELQDLKAAVEELTQQISNPQSFQVSLQRDSSDIKQFRTKMAHVADALERRLDDMEGNIIGAVRAEMSDWADRLENRLGEMEKNIIREVSELRSKVDEVNKKFERLSAKIDPFLEPQPTWCCIQTFDIGFCGFANAISPDGQTFAGYDYSDDSYLRIKFWNLNNGQEICTLVGHSEWTNPIAFSPDGQTLASGSGDQTIKLWNLTSEELICTLFGHSGSVWSIAFSPDGQTLASGSFDNTIKLWNWVCEEEISTLTGHSSGVSSVAFSPDGQTLASGNIPHIGNIAREADYTIKLWNPKTGQEIYTLTGHSNGVISVTFSPDGQTLASCGADKTIKLWNLAYKQEICTLTGHSDCVRSIAFSPDGQILASGSDDKTIKLWDVNAHQEICTLTGHISEVRFVAFTPDGKSLLSSSGEGIIKIWQQLLLIPAIEMTVTEIVERLRPLLRRSDQA
jgi:WD40 repeat protein